MLKWIKEEMVNALSLQASLFLFPEKMFSLKNEILLFAIIPVTITVPPLFCFVVLWPQVFPQFFQDLGQNQSPQLSAKY